MEKFKVGDRVRFVKAAYTGHTSRGVGGTGTVVKVDDDGDIEVLVDNGPIPDNTWPFYADDVELLESAATIAEPETKLHGPFAQLAMDLVRCGSTPEDAIESARKLQEASE